MRNLKKILALVLALVMSFSLMATANAFTDDEQITDTYETAVTVLDGLKVFQGYDDGSFQPQSPIRRSEVAAIIYRIVTGDVTDAQVGIYADYNKFDDVKSTSWYAGYVNFCANAEYIKGRDARTFDPDSYVTGYEALAMILRAIGYDKNGEFTGSSWQVQTAATGELRGITKNITAGTLGTYASREVVAEILFQTILVDKVNYTPAFGYRLDDTSLGWDTFELESIEGVVVANEYADLYGTKPMKAGRTEMIVDGDSYVIDYATTLEDIGENHAAYITEGKNVLAIAKTGNTVFETGAEADIKKDADFEDVTGLEKGDETEYFLNFDGGNTYKSSDWKIAYAKEFGTENGADKWIENYNGSAPESRIDKEGYDTDDNGADDRWVVTVEFPRNTTISQFDIDEMESIFDAADKESEGDDFVDGEVYVGTQSVTDISDDPDVSWRDFLDKYIETDEDSVEVTANENGNWLKVVDVDGDGVADYVMKTIYTFAGVEDIDRDDNIELSALYLDLDSDDELNELDDDIDIVTADELSEGDIVYYAVIDGNAQTYLADVVTAEIDSVSRRDLTATTTDGDEYVESDVHNHTNWKDDGFESGVKNLAGDTSYDLYFDKYGFLGVFAPTATTGEFTLIVNGWYDSLKSGDEYSVLAWNGEDLETIDLTEGGKLFIDKNADSIDNNGWYALREFGDNGDINYTNGYADGIRTIVACLNEDGEIVPVDEVFTRKDVNIIDLDTFIPEDGEYHEGTAYSSSSNKAYNHNEGDVELRALSSTVYYYVYRDRDGDNYDDIIVREYVGYKNTPDLDKYSEGKIEDVYAVGTLTSRESGLGKTSYYTANVIVVEFSDSYLADAEQVFVVDNPVVGNNIDLDDVEIIRANGEFETVDIDLELSNYATYGKADNESLMPGLYYMWETTTEGVYRIQKMTRDEIRDADKYAVGQVSTALGVIDADYVGVRHFEYEGQYDLEDTMTSYEGVYQRTDDSHFYMLGYDVDKHDDLNADLDDTKSAKKVMDERVDISNEQDANQPATNKDDGLYYNNNDVLVAYNSDGEILYAISFNNYNSDMDWTAASGVLDGTDFAQYVWNSVKPNPDPEPVYDVDVNNYFADGLSYKLYDGTTLLNPVASTGTTDGFIYDEYALGAGVYTLEVIETEGYLPFDYYVANNKAQLAGTANSDGNLEYTIVINSDAIVEITADGELETFSVTEDETTKDSDNATVTGLPTEEVDYGTQVTFEVEADFGYAVKDVTASNVNGNVDVVDNGDGTYTTEAITADTTIKVETDPVAVNLQVNFYTKEGQLLPGSTIDNEFTFDTELPIHLTSVAKYEYKTGTKLETGVSADSLTVSFTEDYVSYDEATGEYYVEIRVDYTEIVVNVAKDADIAGDAEGKWKFTGSPATLDALSGDVTVTPTFDGWAADNSDNARWFVIEVEDAETNTFVYGLDNAGETNFEVSLTNISDEEVTIIIKGIYGTEADANAAAEA